MQLNEIKNFLYLVKVQQTTFMKVTFPWEIKLARSEEGYYVEAVCSTSNKKINWFNTDTHDEGKAIEIIMGRCEKES